MESETIAEVGNVRIDDDGYEDEDVEIFINGENSIPTLTLSYFEKLAPEMGDDFQEAVEIARDWYDNGRTHTSVGLIVELRSEHGSVARIPLDSEFTIREANRSYSNDYVCLLHKEDIINDVMCNDIRFESEKDYDGEWLFSDNSIVKE